jgi:hypothetical protein
LEDPPIPDTVWTEDTVGHTARQDWEQTLAVLRALKLDTESNGGIVNLSPAAKQLWVSWYNRHKAEQRSPSLAPCLISPWGKLISYCARFALVLFLLRVAQGDVEEAGGIDEPSMRGAIELIAYFKSHLRAVYARLELSPEDGLAMRALAWLREHGNRCTPRELQRAGLAGVHKASAAKKVLQNLADWGYGRIEEQATNSGRSFVFIFEPRQRVA